MISRRALIDSNVIIAALDADHGHHSASATLLAEAPSRLLAVAAHSYAEAFSTLTRRNNASPFQWPAARARMGLETVAGFTTLIGLTPAQTLDAIMTYADGGGVGPRLFDHLIGQTAAQAGIKTIVTWDTGHMRSLFPNLDVVDPIQAIDARP